jgi:hypothetical protein
MKQIKFVFSILILFFIFSCVSSADTKYQISTKLRDKAIKYNLKKYAENEFNDAEKDYMQAKNYMDTKKSFKADRLLDQVNKKYQIVLDKGFPLCAEDKSKDTADKIKIADSIKSNVAVKDLYSDAQKSYADAEKFKDSKDYENAIDTYQVAQDKFDNVYKTAKEKKDKAEKSIDATDNAFKEIEKNSLEVQKRIDEINASKTN